MKAARRLVRLSERAGRALFAGYNGLEVAVNPFMVKRRLARYRGANSGRSLPNQRRAYQCLNVYGVRIWANKPQQFKGRKWRARCATVARFVALCEFREFRAWQREGLLPFAAGRAAHSWGVMSQFCTSRGTGGCGLRLRFFDVESYPLDAPQMLVSGAMVSDGFCEWPGSFARGGE